MTCQPLHSYQDAGLDFMLNRLYAHPQRKGGGLAADPGVGKTRIAAHAIDTLLALGEVNRVLIVGPPRPLLMTWPQEFVKWEIDRVIRPFGKGVIMPDAEIESISRDSLHHAVCHAGRWDLIVVDESHGFKSWGTLRVKNIRKLLSRTPYRICLTGTPQPNNAQDWFAQTYILDDGAALGKGIGVFRANYMRQGGFHGRQWSMRDGVADTLVENIAHLWYRIKAEDHLDMPDLIVNDMYCQMPATAQRIHADLKKKLAAQLENGNEILAMNAASAYAKLRQVSNGRLYAADPEGMPRPKGPRAVEKIHDEKIDMLMELLESLCGEQLLVFYHFKHDLATIKSRIKVCSEVHGDLTPAETMQNIESWMAGKTQVLVAQCQAAAEGLNLQGRCRHAAWYGLPDISALYTQGNARIYRQGATSKTITIHRLMSENSIEQVQKERLDGKLTDQAQFLNRLKEWARG